jgi:hypothetical protein
MRSGVAGMSAQLDTSGASILRLCYRIGFCPFRGISSQEMRKFSIFAVKRYPRFWWRDGCPQRLLRKQARRLHTSKFERLFYMRREFYPHMVRSTLSYCRAVGDHERVKDFRSPNDVGSGDVAPHQRAAENARYLKQGPVKGLTPARRRVILARRSQST